MSNSPESPINPQPSKQPAPVSPATPTPSPTPTSPTTSAPQPAPNTSLEFNSASIGQWKARQESPFAAQNREAAAKRQQQANERKKAKPYVIALSILAGLLLAGLVVIFIAVAFRNAAPAPASIPTPTIRSGSSEDITELTQTLQQIYSTNNHDTKTVRDSIEKTIKETENGKIYENQAKLAALTVYYNNGECPAAISIAETIDDSTFTDEQKIQFYTFYSHCSYINGDQENYAKYRDLYTDLHRSLWSHNE